MFASPFVLGLASGSKNLELIDRSKPYTGEYFLREALLSHRVTIRHNKTMKSGVEYDRHNLEVLQTVFAAGAVPQYLRKMYVVIENLPGDTYVEHADAIADWSIASSNANLVKLLNLES